MSGVLAFLSSSHQQSPLELMTLCCRGSNYFEVDVDVGSSKVATSVCGMVQGALLNLTLDMAITLEGHSEVNSFTQTSVVINSAALECACLINHFTVSTVVTHGYAVTCLRGHSTTAVTYVYALQWLHMVTWSQYHSGYILLFMPLPLPLPLPCLVLSEG